MLLLIPIMALYAFMSFRERRNNFYSIIKNNKFKFLTHENLNKRARQMVANASRVQHTESKIVQKVASQTA